MPALHRIELSNVVNTLPNIEPIKEGIPIGACDVLLCVLGFEERCLSIPEHLARNGCTADRVILLKYGTNPQDNIRNLPALSKALGKISSHVDQLDADSEEFPFVLRSLLSSVKRQDVRVKPNVIFDISVAANRLILLCLKILLDNANSLCVLYSEAKVYHPTEAEYSSKPETWLSDDALALERGVLRVVVSPEHPGHHPDPLPDCIILFPTFKRDRSLAVISAVDPALNIAPGKKIVWLLGIPHLSQDQWRIEAMRKINSLDNESVPQHAVSTFDYKETLVRLEKIYQERWKDHKITVSPLGSKLQALATSIFCYLHPDVRVMFAVPKEYNATNFSDGYKALWKINFKALVDFRNVLDRVGKLEIVDVPDRVRQRKRAR